MTDTPDKPGKLDLYVEKIVSYMNLDDTQRDDVVREIRSHLEEAIEEGTRRGMTRERAETVAMDRFGDPAMLAGQFGTLQGKMWVVFEALAYALVMFAFMQWHLRQVPNRPEFITNTHMLAIAGVFAAIALTARLWNRVQVNGALRIYRFMRPTLVIPFDTITDVNLQRLHLFGPRKVNIKFGNGKKAQYSSAWPNARCVGIALEVLAPQAIKPRAAVFFRRLRLMAGTESLNVKLGLTAGWLLLAVGLASTFRLLWDAEGMSLVYGLVVIGAGLWLWVQYYSHANRAKRAVLLALQVAFLIFLLPWNVYPLLATADTRPLILLLAVVLPIPVLLLWWRSRNRLALIAVTVAWVAAGYAAAKWVPDNVEIEWRSLGVANGHISNAVWVSGTTTTSPLYAAIGNYTKARNDDGPSNPMLTLTSNAETTDRILGDGMWYIVAGGQNAPVTLLARTVKSPLGDPSPDDSEIYRLDPNGELHKIAYIKDTTVSFTAYYRPSVAVSPGARYHVTTAVDLKDTASDTRKFSTAIFDMETKQLRRLDEVPTQSPWRWTTSTSLEMLIMKLDESSEEGLREYVVCQVNAISGEFTTTTRTLKFKANNYILRETSDDFALIMGTSNFAIANLNTGTSVSLPMPVEEYKGITWDPEFSRVCYLAGDAHKKYLMLAGPEGIISTLPVPGDTEVGLLQLSPDGNKVFYAARKTGGLMVPFGQLCVWDTKRNVDVKIGRASVFATVLAFIYYETPGNYYSSVQWTPDSRSVIWSSYEFGYDRTPKIGTAFRSLDYEAWAEAKLDR